MRTQIIEVTNGARNWGKFLVGHFDREWEHVSAVDGFPTLSGRGHSPEDVLVFDLQTCEGAVFSPGGCAKADLEKHRIWVCPLFEPFLGWLYAQQDRRALPPKIDLPDAPFALSGYRRSGPKDTSEADALAHELAKAIANHRAPDVQTLRLYLQAMGAAGRDWRV